jgi:hypothetical protein
VARAVDQEVLGEIGVRIRGRRLHRGGMCERSAVACKGGVRG